MDFYSDNPLKQPCRYFAQIKHILTPLILLLYAACALNTEAANSKFTVLGLTSPGKYQVSGEHAYHNTTEALAL